ncbi:MAG: FadR family transcriptional regulator [Anaerolineae bacterium]|nr:FadR family transcriptional regulator [Anaerolineae bacterium]
MARLPLDSDLLDFIVKKGFQPGDRLPTITELQDPAQLGISISKVREQLEVARALGVVEVRSKTGMKLREYAFTPAIRLSLFYALSIQPELFEAFSALRNHVEIAFWHEACALLTEEDKGSMRECIRAAREKLSPHNGHIHIPYEEHRAFHLGMFKHLENPFVGGILEAYWDAYEAVEVSRYADYAYHTKVWDYHEHILDAICDGDFERAQELFIEHIDLRQHTHSAMPVDSPSVAELK